MNTWPGRITWGAVALAATASAGRAQTQSGQIARVTAVQLVVQKRAGASGTFQIAKPGTRLGLSDGLRTGKRSKADIKFFDNSLLRLGQLSLVQISSAKEARLVGGSVLFSMLKPGRVVAGAAAAEIKGSVGIVAVHPDGTSDFTLFSGVMDVVSPQSTVSVPPGFRVTAFADGRLSPLRLAAPFQFSDGTLDTQLRDKPLDVPYTGSPMNRLNRQQARPNVSLPSVVPRIIGPLANNPFVTGATQNASPLPIPFPTLRSPIIIGPGVPAQTRPKSAPMASQSARFERQPAPVERQTSPVLAPQKVFAALSGFVSRTVPQLFKPDASSASPPHRLAQLPPEITPSAPILTVPDTLAAQATPQADATPLAPEDEISLDTQEAEAHLRDVQDSKGQSMGGEARLLGALGDGGDSLYGARLEAFGSRGRFFFDLAATPLRVRVQDGVNGRTANLSAISDAVVVYRDHRGDVQFGRQRLISGPTQATVYGSMVRQGGHEVMDGIRLEPNIGDNQHLELAYLYDAFPHNLPYRIRGPQHALYGRFDIERRAGNLGLNLLDYTSAPVSTSLGATLDFTLPVVRREVDFYGEVGRDPFKRSLTTFGLYFPGLYQRTDFDVYLEYAKLRGHNSVPGPPSELALQVFRRVSNKADLLVSLSRFGDNDTSFIVGVSLGARSNSAARANENR